MAGKFPVWFACIFAAVSKPCSISTTIHSHVNMKRILIPIAAVALILSVLLLPAPPPYTKTHESDHEISNLVMSLNFAGNAAINNQSIVSVTKTGDDAMARANPGSPFATITNAFAFLAETKSNNWAMIIGPGLWEVKGGYNTAAPFYTDYAFTNCSIRGSGKYITVISNNNWGDIFRFSYASSFELSDLAFHQTIRPRGTYTDPVIQSGVNVTLFRVFGVTNLTIRNIYGLNIYDIGLWGEQCYYVNIDGVEMDNVGTTNLFVNSQQGDGAGISGTGDHWTISNCKFRNAFYGVEVGGHSAARTNVDWVIDKVSVTSWFIPFALFPNDTTFWRGVTFKNCYASGVDGNTNQTATWNYNLPANTGFKMGNCDDLTVANCVIENCVGGIQLAPDSGNGYRFSLIDNSIFWTDTKIIAAEPATMAYGIQIIGGNTLSAVSANTRWFDGVISGNKISNLNGWGINPMGSNILVIGNQINNVGWSLHPEASAFKFSDFEYRGAFNKGTGKIQVEGNMISARGTSVTAAVSFYGATTNITWINNKIIGGTHFANGSVSLRNYVGYFVTNTTWNAMYGGPIETNFVTF